MFSLFIPVAWANYRFFVLALVFAGFVDFVFGVNVDNNNNNTFLVSEVDRFPARRLTN